MGFDMRAVVPGVLLAVSTGVVSAQHNAKAQWTGTWAAAPCSAEERKAMHVHDQTLRLIVHTSIGGTAARIRLSNTFGTDALIITAAHLALRDTGSTVRSGTDRALTFSGKAGITIPAGASVLSDAVTETIPALSDVSVSLFLADDAAVTTHHPSALQTSYMGAGDQTAQLQFTQTRTLTNWPFFTELDVTSAQPQKSVVTLGSSTTDGAHSTVDTNSRWPDLLACRLQAEPALRQIGVLNEGIGGNRVLHDGAGSGGPAYGPSASSRFDRDVLALAGVKYLVLFEGGNDINHPGESAPLSEAVSADDIIAGYRQIIERAHVHGIRVLLGTITPFAGVGKPATYAEREAKRITVNRWIMSQQESEAAVDFSASIADPAHPNAIAAQYDSGDHLHPNDAGYKAMADRLDLNFFRSR